MAVDGDVQVVVADAAPVYGSAPDVLAAAVDPPPAAVWDAGEFLHIDMQQVAGGGIVRSGSRCGDAGSVPR